MCGISGYISLNNKIAPAALKAASDAIHYRGPDADGFQFFNNDKVGLAHRRLSILDLSTTANQPMFSSDGRYCIIFNGEIYNFKELKEQLSDKGNSLRTTSDTEVIIELFAQKGPAIFKELNGMFSFAIFDTHTQVLTLARDHVGIKPLFCYVDDHSFVFASELKAIRSMVGDKLHVNKEAIPYFLHLGFIPEPATIYKSTYKFASAGYLQIDTNTTSLANVHQQIVPFWKLQDVIVSTPLADEAVAKQQLKELLLDAVDKQMVSDVPIGTFLSGGVDSSLTTALASHIVGSNKIKTFSIAIDSGKYNESAYASQVANHLKTDHHEFAVQSKEIVGLIDRYLPTYDEPVADTSIFPTLLLSKLTKEHVTVALSGDGGDELFHGYGMYQWAKRLSNPFTALVKDPVFAMTRLMGSRYQRAGNMYGYSNKHNLISHIFSQEQYFFSEKELTALLKDTSFSFYAINELPPTDRKLNEAEQQSFWDFNYYLKDDLLVKIDRASMQYSLESRVPLLDYRLVSFAYNLDSQLKMNGGTMKYLLKEVLYDYLPKAIFDRPKRGFSIPLAKWLKTDLKYLLDKYTHESIVEKYNIVHYAEVAQLKRRFENGTDYLYNRLWLIIVLHWWLEENTKD